MPDPVISPSFSSFSSFSSGLACGPYDDPPLPSQSTSATSPASPAASLNACLPPASSVELAASDATSSALAQRFPPNDHAAIVAAPPPPSSSVPAPGVLTVRPDQIDLQLGIPRVQAQASLGSVQLTAAVDVLNANAHLGSLNSDGSRGENIGAGANLLGGELNIDYRGWSLTLGVAASLGGSISSGEGRDIDADGLRERCFAMSLGPFSIGECDEL
jgi:hypothetical protein